MARICGMVSALERAGYIQSRRVSVQYGKLGMFITARREMKALAGRNGNEYLLMHVLTREIVERYRAKK
jgi:hypothetical protein